MYKADYYQLAMFIHVCLTKFYNSLFIVIIYYNFNGNVCKLMIAVINTSSLVKVKEVGK